MNPQVNDVSTPGLDEAGKLAAERSDGGVAGGGKNPAPESFALVAGLLNEAIRLHGEIVSAWQAAPPSKQRDDLWAAASTAMHTVRNLRWAVRS